METPSRSIHSIPSALSIVAKAAVVGLCLLASGCVSKYEARLQAIEQESIDAEARADEDLAADEEACAGDPDCLRAAGDRYSAAMREVQAKRDAQVDVLLEESREGR